MDPRPEPRASEQVTDRPSVSDQLIETCNGIYGWSCTLPRTSAMRSGRFGGRDCQPRQSGPPRGRRNRVSYTQFVTTLIAGLAVMFVLSLEHVRSLDHFYFNASNFYISLTMVAVMGLIMLRRDVAHVQGSPQDPGDGWWAGGPPAGGLLPGSNRDVRRRQGLPRFDDPAPFSCAPRLRGAESDRPRDHLAVPADHREPNRGNQPDEADGPVAIGPRWSPIMTYRASASHDEQPILDAAHQRLASARPGGLRPALGLLVCLVGRW